MLWFKTTNWSLLWQLTTRDVQGISMQEPEAVLCCTGGSRVDDHCLLVWNSYLVWWFRLNFSVYQVHYNHQMSSWIRWLLCWTSLFMYCSWLYVCSILFYDVLRLCLTKPPKLFVYLSFSFWNGLLRRYITILPISDTPIWRFPEMGDTQNGWFTMENPIK